MEHPIAMIFRWLPLLAVGGFAYAWLSIRQARQARQRATDFIASLNQQRDELQTLADKGDFDSLEKRSRALLANPRAKPVHAVAHFQLASIEERRGDFDEMVTHLRAVADPFSRAPTPPTEFEAREQRGMRELVAMSFAFALAATGDVDAADAELQKFETVAAAHETLKLRARAVILARRGEWETLASALAVNVDDDPTIGPASKLLLRTLKQRSAVHAYRSSANSAADAMVRDAEDDENAQRMRWVEKALGD